MIHIDHKYTTNQWWNAKKNTFILRLIIFGLLAVLIHEVVIWTLLAPYSPYTEFSLINTLMLLFFYTGYIVLASTSYNFMPFLEKIIKPKKKNIFRIKLFNIGSITSCAIMYIPTVLIISFHDFFRTSPDWIR